MADGSDPDLLFTEEVPISDDTGLMEECPELGISHTSDCAIVRYGVTGKLDTTFGPLNTGMVSTSVSEKYNTYLDCALQSDNKIVVLGVSRNARHNIDQFVIVRYLSDGILDHTFGTQGIVAMSIGTGNACAKNIAVQPDGKILVTGFAKWGQYYKFTLVRYNSDGSLDTEFGENGCIVVPIGSYDDRSLALIPYDNGVFMIGDSYDGSKYHMTLVKLECGVAADQC